jgi:hypothetical protein
LGAGLRRRHRGRCRPGEELRSEYEEWKENLPENLQEGTLAEKLEAVCDLEFDGAIDDLESLIGEAEGMDLPLGFGRD